MANIFFSHNSKVPRISACLTLETALDTTYDHLHNVCPRDLAAFWNTVPKFLQNWDRRPASKKPRNDNNNGQKMKRRFETILGRSLEDINLFGARDLATTSLSLAKIVKCIGSKGNYGKGIPNGGPHQILHDLLIGNNSEDKQLDFIFLSIAEASRPILSEFDVRCISNLVYAFGLAGCDPKTGEGRRTFFDILASEAIPNLRQFNSQDFANLVWACATLNKAQPELFRKIGDRIVALDSLRGYEPQHLSNICWSYATAKESHPKLFKKIADHIVALDSLRPFIAQNLSNIVWAYATANESHPLLFQKISEAAIKRQNELKPQEIGNVSRNLDIPSTLHCVLGTLN